MARRSTLPLLVAAVLIVAGTIAVVVGLAVLLDDERNGDDAPRAVGDAEGDLDVVWTNDAEIEFARNLNEMAAASPGGEPIVAVPLNALNETDRCGVRALDRTGDERWRVGLSEGRCSANAVGDVAAADVTGDGRAEFLVGTADRTVLALDAASGEEVGRYPTSTFAIGSPAVADVTGDGERDLVAADYDGTVRAFDREGAVEFSRRLPGQVWGAPVPIDGGAGDGAPSVAVAGGEIGQRGALVALDADGERAWRVSLSRPALAATLAERNGTDDLLVAAARDGAVVAVDPSTGDRRWEHGAGEDARIGDADGRRAYAADAEGTVAALALDDGAAVWERSLVEDAYALPGPVLADVTGDGERELVVLASGGEESAARIAVLDPDTGDALAVADRDGLLLARPLAVDLDGDGSDELAVLRGDGRVAALSYDPPPS